MKAINQKQEHTSSYYAATANERTDYPVLEGSKSVDVCVVGAGFTGVSTALDLAERGYSVALVEANRVGWGASGRNGGHLINGISGLEKIRKKHGNGIGDMLWDLRWRGNDIIYDRVEKYDIQCDLKSGFVEVALKPRQMADLEEYAALRESHKFPYKYELWDKEKTRTMLGTDAYIGGFACYRDGHLHPLNLCIGEARAAHELGVQIFEQSPVSGIEHGKRPNVKTANGHVQADSVVLAGNAYSLLEPKHCPTWSSPPAATSSALSLCPERWSTRLTRRTFPFATRTKSSTTSVCPPTSACYLAVVAITRAAIHPASRPTLSPGCSRFTRSSKVYGSITSGAE